MTSLKWVDEQFMAAQQGALKPHHPDKAAEVQNSLTGLHNAIGGCDELKREDRERLGGHAKRHVEGLAREEAPQGRVISIYELMQQRNIRKL